MSAAPIPICKTCAHAEHGRWSLAGIDYVGLRCTQGVPQAMRVMRRADCIAWQREPGSDDAPGSPETRWPL